MGAVVSQQHKLVPSPRVGTAPLYVSRSYSPIVLACETLPQKSRSCTLPSSNFSYSPPMVEEVAMEYEMDTSRSEQSTASTLVVLDNVDTKMLDLKHENAMLLARNQQLENELALLRCQQKLNVGGPLQKEFCEGPPRTVSFSDIKQNQQLEKLLKKGETEVARFFSHKIEDPRKAVISVLDERYLLLRGSSLSVEFFQIVSRTLGEHKDAEALSVMAHILFELAFSAAESFAKHSNANLLVYAGCSYFSFCGCAAVTVLPETRIPCSTPEQFYTLDDRENTFEADAYISKNEKVNRPVCIVSAGFSSGWTSYALQSEVMSVEILCKARGDPCCRFITCHSSTLQDNLLSYKQAHPELNYVQQSKAQVTDDLLKMAQQHNNITPSIRPKKD